MEGAFRENRYTEIEKSVEEQRSNYRKWLEEGALNFQGMVEDAKALGLVLNLSSGQIHYDSVPSPRPSLSFDLIYVRHGKTA